MLSQVVIIFSTAILSSLFTAAAAYGLYRWRLRQDLEAGLATALAELEKKLDAALEALGPLVEERVRLGVIKGVASIPSAEVLTDTTKSVAKTGADLASLGLRTLLGKRSKKRD